MVPLEGQKKQSGLEFSPDHPPLALTRRTKEKGCMCEGRQLKERKRGELTTDRRGEIGGQEREGEDRRARQRRKKKGN